MGLMKIKTAHHRDLIESTEITTYSIMSYSRDILRPTKKDGRQIPFGQ